MVILDYEGPGPLKWVKKNCVDSHLLSLRYSEPISSVCSKNSFIPKVVRGTGSSKNMDVNLTALLLVFTCPAGKWNCFLKWNIY